MSKLDITQRHNTNVTILDLSGKVQIGESSTKLRTTLRELIRDGEKHILINLAEVSNIDSSGLGEFVGSFASLRKNGGELKLFNLTDRISEIMMITKLLTVFDVYENEKEAINSFQNFSEDIESD